MHLYRILLDFKSISIITMECPKDQLNPMPFSHSFDLVNRTGNDDAIPDFHLL